MKKLLSALCAVLLLAVCLPAFAQEGDWAFDLNDFKVTDYLGQGGTAVIPQVIQTGTADILGAYVLNGNETVTSLTLPATLRQVEGSAVSFCANLEELIIPEGLQVVGDNCFVGNPALKEITLPASLRYIGPGSFGSNESLAKVTFLGDCPVFAGDCLDWIAPNAQIFVPDDRYDVYAAALSKAQCTAAVLPSGENAVVTDLAADPSLFEFDPATGTILRYAGFEVCVEVPAQIDGVAVKAIGEGAFNDHRYLCCLTLPEGLEAIGASAFEGCDNLVHIQFPSTLKVIGSRAFYLGYKGYELVLPGVETIGEEAFAHAVRISAPVYLPEGLKTIGQSAFYGCGWLSEVYLPASVEAIGEKAFADSGVSYIVFEGQRLPAIAADAFENCSQLADIDLHTKATKKDMLDLQAVVDAMGLSCRVWRMQNPDVDYINDGLDVYENDVMVGYTGTQTHLRPWDLNGEIDVTALGPGAFKNNQTIAYFAVPYNDLFTTIGAEAFAGSSVGRVDLFDSVTTIEEGAFKDCVNLEELVLPESVTSVGSGALRGCTGLKKLTVLCDPAILPDDLLEGCGALEEVYAGETATDEQIRHLSRVAGRAWNQPALRLGETPAPMQVMPYEPLSGEDFWYDAEFARLDCYNGYERNLVFPREIDGVALNTVGGSAMSRAARGDNYEMELPAVSVVIPETYSQIVPYAFANCETLETVICYAPLELLADHTFANCANLRQVIFVNGVKAIGANVFDNCPSLETIYIGPYTQTIDEKAFLDENGQPVWAAEKCLTDTALMPDADALLSSVKLDPIPAPEPAAADPAPAVPVGEEGAPFVGMWYGTEMDIGGERVSLSAFDMVMTLLLCDDGRLLISDSDPLDASLAEERDWMPWRAENGAAYFEESVMTLTEDGSLCVEEEGVKIYFLREKGDPQPEENTAAPAGSLMTEVKYLCLTADMNGIPMDTSNMGGEYSLLLHENGDADFLVAGVAVPGIKWEKTGDSGFCLDYNGAKLEAVYTHTGFDLDYFSTLLMHFTLGN